MDQRTRGATEVGWFISRVLPPKPSQMSYTIGVSRSRAWASPPRQALSKVVMSPDGDDGMMGLSYVSLRWWWVGHRSPLSFARSFSALRVMAGSSEVRES